MPQGKGRFHVSGPSLDPILRQHKSIHTPAAHLKSILLLSVDARMGLLGVRFQLRQHATTVKNYLYTDTASACISASFLDLKLFNAEKSHRV